MQLLKPFPSLIAIGVLVVIGGIISLFLAQSFAEREFWFTVFLLLSTAAMIIFLEAFIYHYTKSYRQIPWMQVIHIGSWVLAILGIWCQVITGRFASRLPVYASIVILSIGHLAFGINLVAGCMRGKHLKA